MSKLSILAAASVSGIALAASIAAPATATGANVLIQSGANRVEVNRGNDNSNDGERNVEIISDDCQKRVSVTNGSRSVLIQSGNKCEDNEGAKDDKKDQEGRDNRDDSKDEKPEDKQKEIVVTPEDNTPPSNDKIVAATKETPAELPSTGPAELVASTIGLGSLAGAGYYFRDSRRKLAEALNR